LNPVSQDGADLKQFDRWDFVELRNVFAINPEFKDRFKPVVAR
jgi:hypothetical protein